MRPLPYVPPPFPGELLSSWLRRIAAEYGVELQLLAKHVGLSVSRADDIDSALSADDLGRIAVTLNTNPEEIRDMVHPPQIRVLRATTLLQICRQCQARHRATTRLTVAIRAWFEFWRIECQHCKLPFSPAGAANLARCNPVREHPAWFESLRPTARAGARLLAKFARRPYEGGISPTTVLRLLSMRFDAACLPMTNQDLTDRFATRRLVELFVPGLSERAADDLIPEPWTAKKPVRLVTARTILLAGMANFLRDHRRAVTLIGNATAYANHRHLGSLLTGMGAIIGGYRTRPRSYPAAPSSCLTIWSNSETDPPPNSQIKCSIGALPGNSQHFM